MKISPARNKSALITKIIIAVVIVGLLAAGAIAYAFQNNKSTNSPVKASSSDTTQEQIDNGQTIKNNSVNNTESSTSDSTKTSTSGSNTASNDNIIVTITSPADQSGATFSVRSFINLVTSDGTCSVTLTRSGETTVTQSHSGLQPQSNISGCQTFDIPTSNLSKGAWNLKVSYSNNSGQSGSATQEITIR